jgi:hypothetical protein
VNEHTLPLVLGTWTCACGYVRFDDWRSELFVESTVQCEWCGDAAVLIPLPLGADQ